MDKNRGKSINNMITEMFQNLEFTTENLWGEFVNQYKLAAKRHNNNLTVKAKQESADVDHNDDNYDSDSIREH